MTKTELVKILGPANNFTKLRQEVLECFEKYSNGNNQIMLQTLQEGVEDWCTGVGSIEKLNIKQEDDYLHIQPSLKGSLIEELILGLKGYRTRIMRMKPISCYSVHKDFSPRVHIPITTNAESFMIWPIHQVTTQLKPGIIYWTDTTKSHTAINGGDTDRIHIVTCI